MSNRLSEKRILITGAAQGIGLAIAKACAAEGASLFLIDMDGALLAREAEALRAAGAVLGYTRADIADASA
ncbi:MAG: SDR family NAD(P)-dependent oxidoreductase, partial [Rhizobiaceae bacterium]|nr:SDR family NAD(P)-dependent oxidoreductase [Rhizobiaceae bacterium]